MRRSDAVLSVLVLAPIAPIALLLAGMVLDATALRRRLTSLFSLRMRSLTAVALFYSIGLYGMFMGFVVVDALVGVVGGYVIGRRATIRDETQADARRDAVTFAWMAVAILFALCCASAWLALSEPSLGRQLRGMFGLPFTPGVGALRVLIIGGGTVLVAAEYRAALVAARWGARLLGKSH